MTREAQDLVGALREASPRLVELAELASIAARIEPELLRALRLEMMPDVEAGVEADLWFSPLIQSYSPQALSFSPDVQDELRTVMADPKNDARLRVAYQVISRVHTQAASPLRLEEEITFLALARKEAAAREIDRKLQSAIRAMAESPARGRALARWAALALPRLPRIAQEQPSASLLGFAAGVLLGGRRILEQEGESADGWQALPLILPALPPRKAGVRLVPEGVQVGPVTLEGAQEIDVPETDPLILELTWKTGGNESEPRLISWQPGAIATVPVIADELTLRTVRGQVYTLRSRAPRPAPPRETVQMKKTAREAIPTIWYDFQIILAFDPEWITIRCRSRMGEGEIRLPPNAEQSLSRTRVYLRSGRTESREIIGAELFDLLFQGDVLELYRKSLAQVRESESEGLRITLAIPPPGDLGAFESYVRDLPWEWLYDAQERLFLVLDPQVAFSRRGISGQPRASKNVSGPLRLLLADATAPEAPIEVERPLNLLKTALAEPLQRSLIEINVLRSATFEGILDYLKPHGCDILYLTGPSAAEPPQSTEKARRANVAASSSTLSYGDWMRHAGIGLAVLHPIAGAGTPAQLPLYADAAQLFEQQRIPAVVALPPAYDEDWASEFLGELIRLILAGTPVDIAVSIADRRLAASQLEFGLPAIFAFLPDTPLFELHAIEGKSKLGVFVPNLLDSSLLSFVEQTRPRLIVTMRHDPDLWRAVKTRLSPGTFLIGRSEVQDPQKLFLGNPEAGAQDLFKRMMRDLQRMQGIYDAWEGLNEPLVHSAQEAQRLSRFYTVWGDLMRQAGFVSCAYSFSSGQPDLSLWPALAEGLRHCDLLSLHEYSWPSLQEGAGQLCLRYRSAYGALPRDARRPIVISELGLDTALRGEPVRGGAQSVSESDYLAMLQWYDRETQKDSYVVGAAIFSLGLSASQWYDISGAKTIHAYLAQGGAPAPVHLEPPFTLDSVFALIVGSGPQFGPAPGGANAQTVVNALADPKGGGLRTENIRLLMDEGATERNILQSLDELDSRAGPNVTLVVYVSGQGVRAGASSGDGFVFLGGSGTTPVQSSNAPPIASTLSTQDLKRRLQNSPIRRIVLLMDLEEAEIKGPPPQLAVQAQPVASPARAPKMASLTCWHQGLRASSTRWRLTPALLDALHGRLSSGDGLLRMRDLDRFIKVRGGTDLPEYFFESTTEADFPFALVGGGDISRPQAAD